MSEVIRERYIKQHDAVTNYHNVCVCFTVLLILRPCLLLRSLMSEFHTSARRVTVNADVIYLSFQDNYKIELSEKNSQEMECYGR
ncbi:MAG: hypothetical protein PVH58_08675 [Desulfobacterales bacterium]|jgi:hypothetical protein